MGPEKVNCASLLFLPEPLARLLEEYAANKSGYLFATKSGRPLGQRNVLRAAHATGKKVGLHSFRRFRTETLCLVMNARGLERAMGIELTSAALQKEGGFCGGGIRIAILGLLGFRGAEQPPLRRQLCGWRVAFGFSSEFSVEGRRGSSSSIVISGLVSGGRKIACPRS
jgi:hypothetical protein